jgi:molybdenum cofactor sulfurtransferase
MRCSKRDSRSGAGEIALQISRMELAACFSQSDHIQRLTYDDFRTCIDDKASGAVRISIGMVSNFEDTQTLVKFAEGLVE